MSYSSQEWECEECGNTNQNELYLIPHPTDSRWKTICIRCLKMGRRVR